MSLDKDMFEPLGDAERVAPASDKSRRASAAADDVTPMPVAPPDAPKPDFVHRGLAREPDHIWEYRNAAGETVCFVCRFNTIKDGSPDKEFRPHCWCRWVDERGNERFGWRWKAPPVPRPLYRLPELLARPEAPVIICEGEKAADAAAQRFPDCVATSPMNGARSPHLTDWSPLAGRCSTPWPDHDSTGVDFAEAAARLATAAGAASVSIVAVPQDWPQKWDLADPLPEGVGPEALALLLAEARPWVPPAEDFQTASERLAALPPHEYDRLRQTEARRLGVRQGTLDDAVKRARAAINRRSGARRLEEAEPEVLAAGNAEIERIADGSAETADFAAEAVAAKPDLIVWDSDLPATARALRDLLAATPHLFDRGMPVKLARDALSGALVVRSLTVESVVHEAHRVARPVKLQVTETGIEMIPVTLPDRVARLYLDMKGEWRLRALNGVTTAPILSNDGSVLGRNGYDEGTGLWCDAVETPPMPHMPPMPLAAAALGRLRANFRTFPFADAPRVWDATLGVEVADIERPPGRDESAFLAGLVTAVCRPSLRLAPGLLLKAPQLSGAGTGKGLLVRAICTIAFGQAPRAFTVGHDREELEKRIAAALIEAEPTLFLDNVNNTALRSATLASAMTERPAQVRDFGKLRMLLLNSTAFVVVTGNALTILEDLVRRFMTAELDARMEDPEERPFPPGFLNSINERRVELLTDILTIWRWGRQNPDALKRGKPLGSFETWTEWVRNPLLTLGCADPVERISEVKGQDERRRRIAEILTTWRERHGDAPMKASGVDEDVRRLIDPHGRGRQFVATAVKGMVGTCVAGLTLTVQRGDGKWAAATYAVCQTTTNYTKDRPEHRDYRGHREADAPSGVPTPPIPNVGDDPELDPIAIDDGVPPNEETVL
jgi:putative DNA primase/helicase